MSTTTSAFPSKYYRLKYAATLNDESLGESTEPDAEIRYVDIGNVDSSGLIHEVVSYRFENAPSRARRIVRDGDVIVSTVRTYLQAIAPIANPEDNLIVSTGFAVVRPKATVLDPHFCKYLFRECGVLHEIEARSVGVSYPAINSSDLADIAFNLPPLDVQQRIASYLDSETSEIDGLIGEKERMLSLLEEKRAALVTHAVTRGLDPNAPLKPSGLEWLGDIPEHWEMKPIKHMSAILRGKFTHRPRNDPRFYDGPYPFVQTGDISSANMFIREYHQTLNDAGLAVSKMFPKQTLVMAIAANVGDVAILDFEACFPDSIVGFVPTPDIELEYFYYLFQSMRQVFFSTATLNTQLNLNIERVGTLVTVLPPIKEQRQIVAYINDKQNETHDIYLALKHSIRLIKERRSALITAAVTGQIPVEEMAG